MTFLYSDAQRGIIVNSNSNSHSHLYFCEKIPSKKEGQKDDRQETPPKRVPHLMELKSHAIRYIKI